LLNARRSASRRERHYADAADGHAGEAVVVPLVSAYLQRISAGPEMDEGADRAGGVAAIGVPADTVDHGAEPASGSSAVVLDLALHLRAVTTDEEQLLLTWVAEGVPHRTISAWLGIRYEAATKRVWRLCQKLRAAAVRYAATLPPEAQAEVTRFLRRAGALPPLVLPAPPGARPPLDEPRSPASHTAASHTARSHLDRAAQAGAPPAAPDPPGHTRRGAIP
jgi:DNA-directed RNA polymerase specialized sigma24 family protein